MSKEYFETIKCEDYEIYNLSYHQKRVSNTISMNLNLQDYIYPPTSQTIRCKLIYNQEGILDVHYFEYKKKEIKSFKIIYDNEIEYSKKYLNRNSLDKLFNQKKNKDGKIADEIIIVKNGFVTDTSIANIAIFNGQFWLTPKKPLLEGTTRARYLEKKEIFEEDITVEMLKKAKKIALMNAMIDFDIKEDYSFF